MTNVEFKFEKDEVNEHPVPTSMRSTFSSIVDAFVKKDYSLTSGITGVSTVSRETAKHISDYIADYGESLMQLPDDTWESSVCIWTGSHWEVLIDLWTAGEGRSDLVLGARISECPQGHLIDISMVYVP